jgi:hypothetical protein
MGYRSKIRMSIGWTYPIGILTSYLIAIIEWAIRDYLQKKGFEIDQVPFFTFLLVSLLFIVLGILQWFRYRNWIYPVLGVLMGAIVIQASFAMPGHFETLKVTYFLNFIIIILFVIVNWNTIYHHERFEINSRRLFRLAAERIIETSDGFTERPYSAGSIQATRDELLGLSRYLNANYIVRPFYLEDSISMAFSMNKSLMVVEDPSEVSHVTMDSRGNISVKISEKDYRDYRHSLSFDRLCVSMASVFTRFLEYYKNGHESRILSELKSAR